MAKFIGVTDASGAAAYDVWVNVDLITSVFKAPASLLTSITMVGNQGGLRVHQPVERVLERIAKAE